MLIGMNKKITNQIKLKYKKTDKPMFQNMIVNVTSW